jgi:hypothetical protein
MRGLNKPYCQGMLEVTLIRLKTADINFTTVSHVPGSNPESAFRSFAQFLYGHGVRNLTSR